MKALSASYTLEANIILRYLMRDNEDQWKKADAMIRAMAAGKLHLVCDPVTLAEVVWTLGSFYKLDRLQIREGLEPIVASESFHLPDKDIYLRALALYEGTENFHDACACAMATETSEGRLLSFDKKLSHIEGISRVEEVAD